MKNDNLQPYNDENRSRGDISSNNPGRDKMDLTDPQRDQDRLKPEEVTIDLPDVKDIPGQEFVHAPPLGMLADTTISSADEEGEGLFEEDETDIVMGTEADITKQDKQILETGDDYIPTKDANSLRRAALDNTDFDGEELNEGSFGDERSGRDLDTGEVQRTTGPVQETDEENKNFSLGSDENDSNENRS
ncbi:MAG: hypothetical protein ABR503_00445 [Chitinophagaceae bacterium]